MTDREKTPAGPIKVTGGETKPSQQPAPPDPAADQKAGGMTSQGGEAPTRPREGGMIGEG
ncbi:MAG: hypothetical protein ABIO39_06970 [Caulobacteraceae bacterium]